jgi:squalene-hopene/tetraprenyl-beta-curcumene cyclase
MGYDMRKLLVIAAGVIVGTSILTAVDVKLKPGDADQPKAKIASLEKGARYLDTVALKWTQDHKCVSCHTTGPYLMARSVLQHKPSAEDQAVRQFFQESAANWDRGQKGDKPKGDAYVVVTAVGLAFHDAGKGKLHPTTRKALDRMWTIQLPNGAWNWIKCNWPPLEHDDYFGAVLAAAGVANAPDDYAKTDSAGKGLAKLRDYFAKTPAPSLHHRAWLLWSSTKLDGLMSKAMREKTIKDLLVLQKEDGGWSLPSLGDWKGNDGRDNDTKAPSDGYASGLVVYVLRQAGLPAHHAAVKKGADWLKCNQRVSGQWFTHSLNNDRNHFISHTGTAFAILALKACE